MTGVGLRRPRMSDAAEAAVVAAVGAVLASAAGRGLFPLPLAGHGGVSASSQVQQTPEPHVLWPGRRTELFGRWFLPCLHE